MSTPEPRRFCSWCGRLRMCFIDEDLPVGPRAFCSESCWAIYSGLTVMPEGHYGFVKGEV